MNEDSGRPGEEAPEPGGNRGFRSRKREDHALVLIQELRSTLSDLVRTKRILLELGRFYDPVLGGAIIGIEHAKQILGALERGRPEEAEALIEVRYRLYIQDRVHLGGGDQG